MTYDPQSKPKKVTVLLLTLTCLACMAATAAAQQQSKKLPLPITRKDLALDVIMRVYQPNLKKMKTWKAPKAEMVSPS